MALENFKRTNPEDYTMKSAESVASGVMPFLNLPRVGNGGDRGVANRSIAVAEDVIKAVAAFPVMVAEVGSLAIRGRGLDILEGENPEVVDADSPPGKKALDLTGALLMTPISGVAFAGYFLGDAVGKVFNWK